jgi:hypothetical protein
MSRKCSLLIVPNIVRGWSLVLGSGVFEHDISWRNCVIKLARLVIWRPIASPFATPHMRPRPQNSRIEYHQ